MENNETTITTTSFIHYGFLTGRLLKVKVGEAISTKIKMEAGTPQGAVLSPTLFNIFMDDLVDCLNYDQSIKLAQYADDIAIWRGAIGRVMPGLHDSGGNW